MDLQIEIEAYKNGESLYFNSIYMDDLTGETGFLINHFMKGSKGCDSLIVYLGSEDNLLEVWEKEINDKESASVLLDVLKEVSNKGAKV